MKRFIGLALVLVLLTGITGVMGSEAPPQAIEEEMALKSREVITKVLDVPGRETPVVWYAQNSPEWAYLFISNGENDKTKHFGASACVVTACAIAVASMVPKEQLPKIRSILRSDPRIDTQAAGLWRAKGNNSRFRIEDEVDYFRYFPLILGSFASGNNNVGIRDYQNQGNYRIILDTFGLKYEIARDMDKAIAALEDGGVVITSSGGTYSPIAVVGHYFTLVGVDEEYIYYADPFAWREEKPMPDKEKKIEFVQQGLYRFKKEDIPYMRLNAQFIIQRPENAPVYTQDDIDQIIQRSNALATTRKASTK